jgi:hypothetical protein
MAATTGPQGTDGTVPKIGRILSCPNLGPYPAISGHIVTQTKTEPSACDQTKNPGKQAVSAAFQGTQQVVYKMEPRGIEPLTSALRTLRSPS